MNKKIIMSVIALALVAVIGVALVACGNSVKKVEFTSTTDVINNVIDTYAEEEKFFAMGGDTEAPVDGKAGLMNLANTETVNYMLHTNDDLIAQADEVASFVHGMNANSFTSGAFKLKDAATADAFITSLKDSVLATQWMCGFPEKIVIVNVNGGDYVVYAIGNGELIDNFKTKLTTLYAESATVVVEEAVE